MVLVYGSFAKGNADTSSDLDVLVVGAEPTPGAADAALRDVGTRVGREISVRVVPHAEYLRAANARSGFIGSVLAGPVIALRGRP
jgi:predicted nucleotidyltransferase